MSMMAAGALKITDSLEKLSTAVLPDDGFDAHQ